MNSVIKIFDSMDSLTGTFAEELEHFVQRASGKVNIALSGGSTPKALFSVLAGPRYISSIKWDLINFFWGDERCVPHESKESNYGEAYRLLFGGIQKNPPALFAVAGEKEPVAASVIYTGSILQHVPQTHNNLPVFDWVILGIGTDGHTASIFPDAAYDFRENPLTYVAVHPETGQKRISFTYELINNASRVTFLVSGKEKAAVVEEIISRTESSLLYPAAHIKPTHGFLEWYLDSPAASELKL